MGLWASWDHLGYGIHQWVNRRAFNDGWMIRIFNNAAVHMDKARGGYSDSYLHAMSDYRYSKSYSIGLANHHVITGFGMARYYINRGDGRNAYGTLGWVLHTMQDSTSPAHKYFQPWDGSTMWSPIIPGDGSTKWWRHVWKERKVSQLNSGVWSATAWVWHMFYYRLVPTGHVFNF